MDSQRYQRIRAIFVEVLALDSGERLAALERLTEGDEDLRREVENLLEHDSSPRLSLEDPVGRIGDASAPPALERIGAYRVTGTLGTGGMGVVYRAESTSPARTVAIKLVRAGAAGPAAARRFEHESDALARLQHPGIAQIFEAGTADLPGFAEPQPFIAMELVEGVPISRYAEERGLDRRSRLELVARVCDAAEHAHQRGVIHRDLKPGNILVTAEGQPKILDFGIARLTDADPGGTLRTGTGQLLGTLAYMSPEQVEGRTRDIDTRTDVYALGALLFEMLAGALPHDLVDRSLPEAARIVRDEEPRPLSSFDRSLRGDLETIVGRALERDPDRRYASPAALADDLRRHLRDQPILARPASTLYQLRKFGRRHRVLVIAAGAIVLSLVAGVIATAIALGQARSNLAASRVEARTAREVAEFIRNTIAGVDPAQARGATVTLRDALDQAAARIGDLDDEPEVASAIHQTIGSALLALAEFDRAEHHLRRALEQRRDLFGDAHRETAKTRMILGELLVETGALDESASMLLAALATPRSALPEDDSVRFKAEHALGRVEMRRRNTSEAESHLRTALHGLEGAEPLDIEAVESTQNDLAVVFMIERRYDEAEAAFRAVLDTRRARYGDAPHPHFVSVLANLAQVLRRTGRLDEALPFAEEAVEVAIAVYEPMHPRIESVLGNLGTLHRSRGDLAAAEAAYRSALDIRRANDAGGPRLAMTLQNFASLLHAQGKLEEATERFDEALAIIQARGLDGTAEHATILLNRGALDRDAGRLGESIDHLRRASEIRRRLMPGRPRLATVLASLGQSLLRRAAAGDAEAAEAVYREAEAVERTASGPASMARVGFLVRIGEALTAQLRYGEALLVLEEADALAREYAPESSTATRARDALERAQRGH